MFSLNSISGVVLRWGLVHLAVVLVIYFIRPGPREIVVFMVFASFTATCLIARYIWNKQEAKIKKVELRVLQAQINPHFLFNMLNTIAAYSRTNPETARRLIRRLASFFRHTLKRHGHLNSLKEEIEYINTYLVLEKARFREKLIIQRDIDPGLLDCQVPALILQPIVENAVKHGIQPKTGAGTVRISIKSSAQMLFFSITDNGAGINQDQLHKVLLPGYGAGNGIGLSNIHQRLITLFGKDYGLRIKSSPDKGTCVSFRVPLIIGADDKGGRTGETQSADCR